MKMKNLKSEEVQGRNFCLPSKKDITPFYETPDFYLSTLLKTKGVDFIGSDRRARRTFFLFENAVNINELVNFFLTMGQSVPSATRPRFWTAPGSGSSGRLFPKQKKWLSLRSRRKVTRLDLRGSVRPSEQAYKSKVARFLWKSGERE
jgi:hypothetical protein